MLLGHGLTGYVKYKCRCPICSEAKAAAAARDRAKNADRIREQKQAWAARNEEHVRAKKRIEYQENAPVIKLRARNRYGAKALDVREVTAKDVRRLLSSPCLICGSTGDPSTDHRIPLSRGGRHSIGNLDPLCRTCNSSKHDLLLVEFRRRLKQKESSCRPSRAM